MEISYHKDQAQGQSPDQPQETEPAAVQTGLTDLATETPAPSTEPINLSMPDEKPQRFEFSVGDEEAQTPPDFKPIPAVVLPGSPDKPLNARDAAEEKWHEQNEAKRRDFMERYYAARKESAYPKVVVQPVAPAVAAQTLAEQEAGRRMNVHHAGLRGGHPTMPPPDPTGAKTVPVFRPSDYTQPPLKTDASQHAPTRTVRLL